MSLHYIIDGYNIIKQVSFLTGKKLRAGREGLVWFIETYRPQGKICNEVTIVFDGKAEISSPNMKTDIRIIFSKGETADNKIKKMVEGSKNPRDFVVVSDDKEIMFYCRSVGSQVLSVKEFLGNYLNPKKKAKQVEIDDKPELDSGVAAEITEDLKKLWLTDERKQQPDWYS